MKVEYDIKGLRELNKVFAQIPRGMQSKVYYRALFSGAGVVRDKAKENLESMVSSEASGTGAKNLRVYRLRKRRGLFRVAVRVRKGAVNRKKKDKDGNPVRVGLYLSVLEYGKKGQTPRPYLRTAIKSERAQSILLIAESMKKYMIEGIDEAKKLAGVPK